ncbi:MAG: CinA family protein [Mycetocola sp.]
MSLDPAADILRTLGARGLTLCVAESLTGGLLADAFVSVPGASASFRGGVVTYATDSKASILGVPTERLDLTGPVDSDVAVQMARGARGVFAHDGHDADIGIATTGVAGPGASDGHPAGTVYVALSWLSSCETLKLALPGDRGQVRAEAVAQTLRWVNERLRVLF